MIIRSRLHRCKLGRHVRTARLGISQEESLFGSKAVCFGRLLLTLCFFLLRSKSKLNTSCIRDVFAQRESSIDVNVAGGRIGTLNGDKLVVFRDKALRARLEAFGIHLRPPITPVSVRIELSPSVIEGVSKLVCHD